MSRQFTSMYMIKYMIKVVGCDRWSRLRLLGKNIRCVHAKSSNLRALGIEPWPTGKPVNSTCKQIVEDFKEDAESPVYQLSGRLLAMREHGKSVFAQMQDRTGTLQLYFKQSDLGEASFSHLLHFVDVGDIVWDLVRCLKHVQEKLR